MNPINKTQNKLDQWLDEFVTERKLWIVTIVCTLAFLLVGSVERALLQFIVMAGVVLIYNRFIGYGKNRVSDSKCKQID